MSHRGVRGATCAGVLIGAMVCAPVSAFAQAPDANVRPATAAAAPSSDAELQQLFARFAALGERRAAFVERRVSVLFRNPPEARGTLLFKPPSLLVRETVAPRREEVRVEGERVTLRTQDESGQPIERSVRLDALPQLTALIGTLRALLAGDLRTLQRGFKMELDARSGPQGAWTLQLTPLDPEIESALQRATVSGHSSMVERMVFVEASGDRTELTLTPVKR